MTDTAIIPANQAVPSATTPLTDRYGRITPTWYPFILKISDFVQGLATGEFVIDGWLQARMITAGLITADMIAANSITTDKIAAGAVTASDILAGTITVDKMDVNNVSVLQGTFGTLQTNATTTRIQITDADNELRCYISGVLVAQVGSNVVSNGAFFKCTSPDSTWYPADFRNSSTTGGDLSTGGGALFTRSAGGYCIQAETTTTSSAISILGRNTGTSGGTGHIGRSTALGGWAFYAAGGTGNYGPFTGGHDGLLAIGAEVEVGDILVDGPVVARRISDCITVMERSTAPGQIGVGVYVHRHDLSFHCPPTSLENMDWAEYHALSEQYDCCVWNALGEGAINVCGEGGDIAQGDLIVTSSLPGKGMKQSDNIVRSITVAKAREAMSFAGATDVKQIACFYIAG